MLELMTTNPWLVVCLLAAIVIVACTAIVFVFDYMRGSRQAEIDATLKQMMLERGMSAADIKVILEASADPSCRGADQPVRVGFGSFKVEVGNQQAARTEAPAHG